MPDSVTRCTLAATRIPLLRSVRQDDPLHPALATFVRAVFRRSFAAEIDGVASELLGDIDADGHLHAVLGLRRADRERLYCETYLDRPIEELIAARVDVPVARSDLVEVAHLAPERAGQMRPLIAALTRHLTARGIRWVTFTTVPRLRNAFRRMGLEPIELAVADPARLPPGERARWGDYYDHRPRVYAGDVAASQVTLTRARAGHACAA
jgi:hypothetical protein